MTPVEQTQQWPGLVATIAALIATVGDFTLLGVANAAALELSFPGHDRRAWLLLGHYLGVLSIPLYALGYWYVSRGLSVADPQLARIVFVAGSYASAVGAAIHGLTTLVIQVSPVPSPGQSSFAPFEPFAAYLGPLWLMAGTLVLVASALHIRLVRSGRTAFPPGYAFVNPAALVAVVVVLCLPSAFAREIIAPAAPNFVHVVYFGLATWVRRNG